MQQFTRKAAPDSYIGHDCLMAVSKKKKSSDSTQIHPPVLFPNGAEEEGIQWLEVIPPVNWLTR